MKSVYFRLLLLALCLPTLFIVLPREAAAQTLTVHYKTIRKQRAGRYDILGKYPVFTGTSRVARLANNTLRVYVISRVDAFVRQANQDFTEMGNMGPSNGYSLELNPVISLATAKIVSVYFTRDTYMGGAHPNHEYSSYTFGMVNNKAKKLSIADLFPNRKDPYALLSSVALPKLKASGASSVTSGGITKLDKQILRSWVVTPQGITLLFEPYAVASYAEGPYETKITWRELGVESRL